MIQIQRRENRNIYVAKYWPNARKRSWASWYFTILQFYHARRNETVGERVRVYVLPI